jgi:hypothetical protein
MFAALVRVPRDTPKTDGVTGSVSSRSQHPFDHAAKVHVRAACLQMKKNSIFAYENTVATYATLF